MRILFSLVAMFILAGPAWGLEVAGVVVEEQVVNDKGTVLTLNGAGIRKKLFFKIYIAELFLEHPHDQAAAAIADPGAKRVVMHFLYDEVGKDKIIEGWNEGFAANVGEEKRAALEDRIAVFNGMFTEDLKEGDIVVFDYLPEKGTVVTIKGEQKGVIEGKDFNDALLSIWLGEEPVGDDLKKALLMP